SAHRTPDDMYTYATKARKRGLQVIIAGAGAAAHLPGMVASKTTLPVIGVPIKTSALGRMDSQLSIVQIRGGVPAATMAIGKAGATNAGLVAAQIISTFDEEVASKLTTHREGLIQKVAEMTDNLANK